MTVRATVITDASYYYDQKKPNHSYGGWAAWVRVDGIGHPIKGYGSINSKEKLTSTICEMYAAINGAWMAKREGAELILVRSDCMAVIHAITRFQLKPALRHIWADALKKADLLNVTLEAVHVPGHGEINSRATYVNDWCDKQAYRGMNAARKGQPCLIFG
jgi:ribonuclease HI